MTDIKLRAELLRKKYDLTKPPYNAETIAENEGVDVQFVNFSPEASKKIHGFYDHDEKRIYVNTDDEPQEKLFTIAHELGHHLLHIEHAASAEYVPRLKFEVDTEMEREADFFAECLLAPSDEVKKYYPALTEKQLSSMFLVSPDIISKALTRV